MDWLYALDRGVNWVIIPIVGYIVYAWRKHVAETNDAINAERNKRERLDNLHNERFTSHEVKIERLLVALEERDRVRIRDEDRLVGMISEMNSEMKRLSSRLDQYITQASQDKR